MKMMKKVTAAAGVVAMLAMNFSALTVNAAVSPDGTKFVVSNDATTFTITSTDTVNPILPTATCNATVSVDGTATGATCSDAAGIITVTPVSGVTANHNYRIALEIIDSVDASVRQYASLVYSTGNNNKVQVSATVMPILKMDVAGTINLGTLTPNTFSATGVTVNYGTNANAGMVITMASTGLKDASIHKEIGQSPITEAATTGNDFYKVSTSTGTVAFDSSTGAISTVTGANIGSGQIIQSIAHPTADTSIPVTIGAQIATDTEAGYYTDTLVFSATASF